MNGLNKIKKTVIKYCKLSGQNDPSKIARAIEWRIAIARNLGSQVKRSLLDFDKFVNDVSGVCLVHRQVEDELDTYQQEIQDLSNQLQNGEIDEDEYTNKLELLTAAIFFVSYLTGSDSDGGQLLVSSIDVLNSAASDELANSIISNQDIIDQYIDDEEARNELDSELAIASTSATGLAAALSGGIYQDAQDSLFGRIALWGTTALGIYAAGQLKNKNNPFYMWSFNPLKDHCTDCIRLNGQVHTSDEWNRSGYRPQSRILACGGWRCGCALYQTNGPSSGRF